LQINFLDSINKISPSDWQHLNTSTSPFLRYEFFQALESSASTSKSSGWHPQHLTVTDVKKNVIAIMPMYLKDHSWGEYVFDWAWADAYQKYNLSYYPKLVATLPFTPTPSDKCLSHTTDQNDIFPSLIEHCQQQSINSWHLLYCPEITEDHTDDVYQRNTVQFHWFNRGYHCFDNFVSTFNSRKRKNTRKERLSIANQGITIRRVLAHDVTPIELDFFYLTYQLTYMKRGHTPHLSHAFFKEIFTTMADNILLVIASFQNNDIACALFFYDDSQLYGRYWGCTEHFTNLHFELCYYQGIEFCIEKRLSAFNPGTQGEHKIQRGFEPILTHSYHWIENSGFKSAIKEFCLQEQKQMQYYLQQCQQKLPFKQQDKT